MLPPLSNLGPYRIEEPLGRGGMASVYKAYEPALDRHVALKVLPQEFLHDPTFAERFKNEARVIAKLEHRHIVPIHAFGIDGGIPWMAMRLLPAGALSSLLARGRIEPSRAVAVLGEAAAALDHAHSRGILHRDVKPQNILLDDEGHAYLADFGIAKMVESTMALTKSGVVTGTPQYMSPEQARAERVDHRTDIYALGVIAYEMFTGHVPFNADTPVAVLMKHVLDPIPAASPDEAPAWLMAPVLKALAKNPDERWQTATDFVHGLAAALGGSATAGHAPTLAQVPPGDVATVPGRRDSGPLAPVDTVRPPPTAAAPEAPGATAWLPPPPPPTVSRPGGISRILPWVVVGSLGAVLLTVLGVGLWWARSQSEPAEASLAASPTPEPDAGVAGQLPAASPTPGLEEAPVATPGSEVHPPPAPVTRPAVVTTRPVASPILSLRTNAPGAAVEVNGQFIGNTGGDGALVARGLRPGSYTVRVAADGFEAQVAAIDLGPGNNVVDVRLAPAAPPRPQATAEPAPATVARSTPAVHRHTLGSCEGVFRLAGDRVSFTADSKGHSFDYSACDIAEAKIEWKYFAFNDSPFVMLKFKDGKKYHLLPKEEAVGETWYSRAIVEALGAARRKCGPF